ncbi:MAG TPA: hypothetical protein VIQ00_09595 [Chitinophagaceae bacterium]
METVIKLHPSELDLSLLDKIKTFIGKNKNVDVIISLREFDPEYAETLNHSIDQTEEKVISMTMEEFLDYSPKN